MDTEKIRSQMRDKAKTAFDFILLLRKGGQVKRFHTEKFIGEETNAAHTFGVLSWVIVLSEYAPSKNLLLAAMYHDIDEQLLGDIPGPAKWYAPEVIKMIEKKQDEFRIKNNLQVMLTGQEKIILKWADKLDLLITCYEQQCMGNNIGRVMCERIVQLLESLPEFNLGETILELWLSHHPEHYSGSKYEGSPYYGI